MAKKLSRAQRRRQRDSDKNKQHPTANSKSPTPPPVPPAILQEMTSDASDRAAEKEEQEKIDSIWNRMNWMTILTGLLAIFALVQALITKGQLDQTRLQLRPWVTFESHEVRVPLDGGTIHIRFDFHNSGGSPAWINTASGMLVQSKGTDTLDEAMADLSNKAIRADPYRTSVSPGQKIPFSFTGGRGVITPEAAGAVMSGKELLYFVGYVGYRDAVGGKHWTTCCYVFDPSSQTMSGHHKYNDMDMGDNDPPRPVVESAGN